MIRPILRAFIIAAATLMSETRPVVAQDDQQCSEYQFDTPFFPANSYEDIYNKNLQSRDKSGYYWITDGSSRVYCSMNYNVATRDKSGYYRVNIEWVFCNMTAIAFSHGAILYLMLVWMVL